MKCRLRISERFSIANLEEPLYSFRRTGNTRTVLNEDEFYMSVAICRREALKRYLDGQDSTGYPSLDHTPIVGIPILDLGWKELGPYSHTLHAWGNTIVWKDNRAAAALHVKAVVLNPFNPRFWAAFLKSWIIQHHRIYQVAYRVKALLSYNNPLRKIVD